MEDGGNKLGGTKEKRTENELNRMKANRTGNEVNGTKEDKLKLN